MEVSTARHGGPMRRGAGTRRRDPSPTGACLCHRLRRPQVADERTSDSLLDSEPGPGDSILCVSLSAHSILGPCRAGHGPRRTRRGRQGSLLEAIRVSGIDSAVSVTDDNDAVMSRPPARLYGSTESHSHSLALCRLSRRAIPPAAAVAARRPPRRPTAGGPCIPSHVRLDLCRRR